MTDWFIIAIDGTLIQSSDEDYKYLNSLKWKISRDGYAISSTNCKMHYLVAARMSLIVPKGMCIDHEDRNKLNNRRDNLRVVTQSENAFNRGLNKNNLGECKGVSFSKREYKWQACISVDGKSSFLGQFNTQEEAIAAYNRAIHAFELFSKKVNNG